MFISDSCYDGSPSPPSEPKNPHVVLSKPLKRSFIKIEPLRFFVRYWVNLDPLRILIPESQVSIIDPSNLPDLAIKRLCHVS